MTLRRIDHSLERDKPGGIGGTNTRPTMLNRLI